MSSNDTDRKLLIVNADDLGMSHGVNLGIIQAHERGIVTSASLMVRWPCAREAATYAREHPELSVGLHVDLGEWSAESGEWEPLYEVVPLADREHVREEVERQLEEFRALMGDDPTHLDSHQHVHNEPPVREVLAELADELGVPLRAAGDSIRYRGYFYGQGEMGSPYPEGTTVDNLLRIFEGLPAGITELACHPGFDDGLATMYRSEREQEVAALTDPRVGEGLSRFHIELISFRGVRSGEVEIPVFQS